MNDLMKKVVDAVAFQVHEHRIKLLLNDLPPCRGDAAQLSQVFTNLVDNAIKYRSDDRPRYEIEIGGKVEGKNSVYHVCDNGIGMRLEHQEGIFELFHRLDPDGLIAGEGIGLTVVKRIVNRLGGSLWVESKEGKGSCFYVSLPAAEAKKEDAPSAF